MAKAPARSCDDDKLVYIIKVEIQPKATRVQNASSSKIGDADPPRDLPARGG